MGLTVVAPDGTYCGRSADGISRFSSIRYGDCERFCAPQPHSDAGVMIDATVPSPLCAQVPNHIEAFIMNGDPLTLPQQEDALYLNVDAPESAVEGASLPVMVWIHGGAFKSGGASSPLYDPHRLVDEGNVIVVSVNYRLGFFGFVRDQEGNLANLGMLDLIEALKWINRNIAAFGGNPDNVTIFGQSAGGSAVQYLLTTQAAGTLFKRAIVQSSCFGALEGREAMDDFQLKLANALEADATTEQILEVQSFAMQNNPEKGNGRYCAFAPRPGYAPLPPVDKLEDAYKSAIAAGVEIMVGYGSREASLYALANPKLARLAKIPVVGQVVERVVAGKSSAIFSDGAKQFAADWAAWGGTVHLYENVWGVGKSLVGGCHCSELPLLLEPNGPHVSPLYMGKSDSEISAAARRLRAIWAGFATDGRIVEHHIPTCLVIKDL